MLYHFHSEHWVPEPLERVFHFFADPENLPRIMPPRQQARIELLQLVPPPPHAGGQPIEAIAGVGSEILLSLRPIPWKPVRILWRARILDFEWNRYFRDVQADGPLQSWTHRHEFEPSQRDGRQGTLIRDLVEYDPGFGPLGAIADALFLRHAFRSMFEYRKKAVERLLLPPNVQDQLRKVGEQLRKLKPNA